MQVAWSPQAAGVGSTVSRPENLARGQADGTGPDDADGLGAQLKADQAGQRVVPLAHSQVCMMQIPA